MADALSSDDTLFAHAACALVLTTSDGLIRRANATACAWFGYAEQDLVDKVRMHDLLPVGARLFYNTHCQPILQVQGSVAEIQMDVRNSRQERLPMLVNIARQKKDEKVLDHWALFKSTDRRAYERELLLARKAAEAAEAELKKLNEKLSAADRRKDEFLATLSHELRNPLAPMRSAVDVFKLRYSNAKDDRLLQVFDRQLHHLTRLVDDLMEISRITQGRMHLQRAPVELTALVRSAAQDMGETMKGARHSLRLFIHAAPAMVDGDATRLTQVVLNLLTNAAKYTPDGGCIELHLRCDAGYAEIQVSDSGIGIPAEALDNVFDMFSQLEPALERAKGGLGIGLALVRGIVELHGGRIHAESAGQHQGSTFIVRLPLVAGDACKVGAVPSEPMLSGVRVLVVDDNEDAAEMLTMALEMLGCKVVVAHTAAQALELVGMADPALALLDIGLPDMNGYELARRLRQLQGGASRTLVATTGWGQEKDRERAFDAGFDHHLTKPIDLELLKPLVKAKIV
ncbi:MAG: PAS domain-containing hybrid sensor histidine kinase/response regulator [Oxalobacteraceae bacterium]|nr:MAG: PAS domain-containing hybrid sensor histidine kinase/response regulator [Oxalobacteraceae bacterium]